MVAADLRVAPRFDRIRGRAACAESRMPRMAVACDLGRTNPRAAVVGTVLVAAIRIVVLAVPLLLIRQDGLGNANATLAAATPQG